MPDCVKDLFTTVRCRKVAVELGFERMMLKDETLKCFFVNNPDSPYFDSPVFQEKIMRWVQFGTNKAKLKQTGRNFMLIVEQIRSMNELLKTLQEINR